MGEMILYIIILMTLLWVAWRFLSNKYQIPCPSWLAWLIALDNPFAKAHQRERIIQALPLQEGTRVLDVGCGPGRVLLPLAKRLAPMNGEITGLDMQQGMLDQVRCQLGHNAKHIDLICGDVMQLAINKQYHIILMVCLLGEIPQAARKGVLKKLSEHVLPQGIISITETVFDPHYISYIEVRRLMHAAGFEESFFMGSKLAYTAHFRLREVHD